MWTDISQNMWVFKRTWEDAQCYCASGKVQMKRAAAVTTHAVERLKLKYCQSHVSGGMWSKWKFHTWLVSIYIGTTALQNSLAFPQKFNRVNCMIQRFDPEYLFTRNEDIYAYIDLYLHLHSSFSHNSQKLKTMKWPLIGEWIKKLRDSHAVEYHSAVKSNYRSMQQHGWISGSLCWARRI